jgi:hypothetical protein
MSVLLLGRSKTTFCDVFLTLFGVMARDSTVARHYSLPGKVAPLEDLWGTFGHAIDQSRLFTRRPAVARANRD